MVVGSLLSYWEGNFSGAMLNFAGVLLATYQESFFSYGKDFDLVNEKNMTSEWWWYNNEHMFFGVEASINICSFVSLNLVGGWTNPFQKYAREKKIGSWNPKVRGQHKKSLKPAPSNLFYFSK